MSRPTVSHEVLDGCPSSDPGLVFRPYHVCLVLDINQWNSVSQLSKAGERKAPGDGIAMSTVTPVSLSGLEVGTTNVVKSI